MMGRNGNAHGGGRPQNPGIKAAAPEHHDGDAKLDAGGSGGQPRCILNGPLRPRVDSLRTDGVRGWRRRLDNVVDCRSPRTRSRASELVSRSDKVHQATASHSRLLVKIEARSVLRWSPSRAGRGEGVVLVLEPRSSSWGLCRNQTCIRSRAVPPGGIALWVRLRRWAMRSHAMSGIGCELELQMDGNLERSIKMAVSVQAHRLVVLHRYAALRPAANWHLFALEHYGLDAQPMFVSPVGYRGSKTTLLFFPFQPVIGRKRIGRGKWRRRWCALLSPDSS